MLTAKLGNEASYNYNSENFKKAFKWLKETNLEELTPGNYPIDGDKVYANVQEYDSMPYDECLFEAHRKYHDIQYVVEGEEEFGYTEVEGLEIKIPYDDKKDLIFFEFPHDAGHIVLHKGEFAIASPIDAHQPRVMHNTSCHVKKIVLKVRVD